MTRGRHTKAGRSHRRSAQIAEPGQSKRGSQSAISAARKCSEGYRIRSVAGDEKPDAAETRARSEFCGVNGEAIDPQRPSVDLINRQSTPRQQGEDIALQPRASRRNGLHPGVEALVDRAAAIADRIRAALNRVANLDEAFGADLRVSADVDPENRRTALSGTLPISWPSQKIQSGCVSV